MSEKSVFINHWLYSKPNSVTNKAGNIVLISKGCVGPIETYEWGIDDKNIPYVCYEWLENDLFKDSSYCKSITKQELLDVINSEIQKFNECGLNEWSGLLEDAIAKFDLGNPES